jgi:hypothetical protein
MNIGQAFELPERAAEPFRPRPLWRRDFGTEDFYGSPLALDDDRLLAVDHFQRVWVIEARTGRSLHEGTLGGLPTGAGPADVFASPALAGGYVYVSAQDGRTWVLEARPPWSRVALNQLDDDDVRASPVFVGSRLYLRSAHFLYCIEEHR